MSRMFGTRQYTFALLSIREEAALAAHKKRCWGPDLLAKLLPSSQPAAAAREGLPQPHMLEIKRPVQSLNQLLRGLEDVILQADSGKLLALSSPEQAVLPLFGGSSNQLFAALDELVLGSTFHLNVSKTTRNTQVPVQGL